MDKILPADLYINIDGVRTRYWTQGESGSAVLLIHGLGGFVENWMHNIGPLSERHRVYALDLLGFGLTDKTPLVRNMYQLVDFIDAFLETIRPGRVALIGNSLGGGLALYYTVQHPEKVDKIVLADNAGMGRQVCADFRWCAVPVLNNFITRSSRESTARILSTLVYDRSKITKEFIDLAFKYASAPGAVKALMTTLYAGIDIFGQRSKLTRRLREELAGLKVPALVIWGRQDRIIPLSHGYIARDRIPGARLEIIDNCGHMPMFEQPEKFNRLVLDFLDGK